MHDFPNSSIIAKLPENHFGEVKGEVLDLILNGQCCAVYGIPGYGMDFFAKHILLLLNKKYPGVKVIMLNLQLDNNKTRILERELARMMRVKKIDEMNLAKLLQKNKVVVILNEVYHARYKKLFKLLKAINSINTINFTVLTVANYTIFKHADEYLKYGSNIFCPLKRIPNFDFEGVKRIMRINNEEHNWNIPLDLARKVLFLSGGNPALVKWTCFAIYINSEKMLNRPDKLVQSQPLNYRLSNIAELIPKLTIEEQIELGILNNNGTLFSDLLIEYLKSNELEGLDKLFPDLTRTDRKILTLFVQNIGRTINKDQLSLILDQTADTYSEWAIYKAVARVRDKIRDRYTIKTLKGRGWRMEAKT